MQESIFLSSLGNPLAGGTRPEFSHSLTSPNGAAVTARGIPTRDGGQGFLSEWQEGLSGEVELSLATEGGLGSNAQIPVPYTAGVLENRPVVSAGAWGLLPDAGSSDAAPPPNAPPPNADLPPATLPMGMSLAEWPAIAVVTEQAILPKPDAAPIGAGSERILPDQAISARRPDLTMPSAWVSERPAPPPAAKGEVVLQMNIPPEAGSGFAPPKEGDASLIGQTAIAAGSVVQDHALAPDRDAAADIPARIPMGGGLRPDTGEARADVQTPRADPPAPQPQSAQKGGQAWRPMPLGGGDRSNDARAQTPLIQPIEVMRAAGTPEAEAILRETSVQMDYLPKGAPAAPAVSQVKDRMPARDLAVLTAPQGGQGMASRAAPVPLPEGAGEGDLPAASPAPLAAAAAPAAPSVAAFVPQNSGYQGAPVMPWAQAPLETDLETAPPAPLDVESVTIPARAKIATGGPMAQQAQPDLGAAKRAQMGFGQGIVPFGNPDAFAISYPEFVQSADAILAAPASATVLSAPPVAMASQVSAALAQMPARLPSPQGEGASAQAVTEFALDPPELGRLRLVLSQNEFGALTLVIQAERPETLDLMRRNAGLLAQEFTRDGMGQTAFRFEGGGGGFGGQDQGQARYHPDLRDGDHPRPAPSITPAPMQSGAAPSARPQGAGRLDLRI